MGIFINLSNKSALDRIPFDIDASYFSECTKQIIKTRYNPNRNPTFIDEQGDLIGLIDNELYVIQDGPLPKEFYEKYPVHEYNWLPKEITDRLF